MVVRLRLQRWGRLHLPFYRVAIADSRRHVTKKVVEYLVHRTSTHHHTHNTRHPSSHTLTLTYFLPLCLSIDHPPSPLCCQGTYNPLVDRNGVKQLRLNIPRVKYWLAVGAQPSPPLRRLLASFNLLPLPPTRSSVPAHPALLRALTGRGGIGEVKGKEEGQPGRQVRAKWVYPSSKGVPYGQTRQPLLDMEREGEGKEKEESGGGDSAPGSTGGVGAAALSRFPFTLTPTPVTFTAWQVAQRKYVKSVKAAPPQLTPPPLPSSPKSSTL